MNINIFIFIYNRSTQATMDINDLPTIAEHSWFLDLPKEIVNEIVGFVPLIDYFRLSKVSKLFSEITHKRRVKILLQKDYAAALYKGDILSILPYGPLDVNKYLLYACEKGYKEIVQLMIYKHAAVLLYEAYECAYKYGQGDIAKYLLSMDFYQYIDKNAYFLKAITENNHVFIHLLKDNPHNDWNSAFLQACLTGNIEVAIMAMKMGISDWQDGFINACSNGHIDIVKVLLENNIIHHYKNSIETYRESNFLREGLLGACENEHLNIIELLVQYCDNDFAIPFITACYVGNLSIVNFFLERNIQNNRANDYFISACRGGNIDVVQLLIDKYKLHNFLIGIQTACYYGNIDIVKLLIAKSRDFPINWNINLMSACDGIPCLPRGLSCIMANRIEIIKLMLEHGASNLIECYKNMIEISRANYFDIDTICKLFYKYGLKTCDCGKHPESFCTKCDVRW